MRRGIFVVVEQRVSNEYPQFSFSLLGAPEFMFRVVKHGDVEEKLEGKLEWKNNKKKEEKLFVKRRLKLWIKKF